MKKIVSIALIAIFTVGAFAQGQHKEKRRHDFTADQMAELKTKKMTLQLDLTEKQQEEVFEINKRNALERKQKMEERKALKQSGKKLNSDEIFAKRSAQLDKMITTKAKMKKILTEEQFETWQKAVKHKAHKIKKRAKVRNKQRKK